MYKTNNIPHSEGTQIATFADDNAIPVIGYTIEESTEELQRTEIHKWMKNL